MNTSLATVTLPHIGPVTLTLMLSFPIIWRSASDFVEECSSPKVGVAVNYTNRDRVVVGVRVRVEL